MVGLPIQTFDDTGRHVEILLSLQRYVKFNPTAPGDGTRDVEACVDLRRTCAKLAHCQAFFIGAVAVLLSVSLILRLLALGIRTPNEQTLRYRGGNAATRTNGVPNFPSPADQLDIRLPSLTQAPFKFCAGLTFAQSVLMCGCGTPQI